MSFGDRYTSSSYRRIFGDSPRSSPPRVGGATTSRGTTMLRSVAQSRNSNTALNSYRRMGRPPSSFALVPSDSLDLSQTSVVNSELKVIRTNEKEQLQVGPLDFRKLRHLYVHETVEFESELHFTRRERFPLGTLRRA